MIVKTLFETLTRLDSYLRFS